MPSRERFWNGSMWTDLERDSPLLSEFLGPIEPTIRALLDSYERSMNSPSVLSRVASRQQQWSADEVGAGMIQL